MSSVHARAKDIFLDAVAHERPDRRAFVEQACGGDAALLDEVESLLKFHDDESTNEAEPMPAEPGSRPAPSSPAATG